MTTNINTVAEAYLAAYDAHKRAEAVLAEAKAALITGYAADDVVRATVGDRVVAVEHKARRSFVVSALAAHLSPEVLALITEPTVKHAAYDKAREDGLISDAAEAAGVKRTEYAAVIVGEAVAAAVAV